MNETLSSSSSEWMQLYQQTIDTTFGFSDATVVSVTGNTSFVAAGDHCLVPKGCISKPIRGRSRASKRTPITLLNADAKNFRSLVQKFTGCRRRSTSISFGNNNPKGPVNINFAHANPKNDHHYSYITTSSDHGPILSQPFVDTTKQEKHYDQCHNYQYEQQLYSNEEQEQEQGEVSFESITSGDHHDHDHDDLFPQGFVMDDLFFLA